MQGGMLKDFAESWTVALLFTAASLTLLPLASYSSPPLLPLPLPTRKLKQTHSLLYITYISLHNRIYAYIIIHVIAAAYSKFGDRNHESAGAVVGRENKRLAASTIFVGIFLLVSPSPSPAPKLIEEEGGGSHHYNLLVEVIHTRTEHKQSFN